MLQLLFSYNKQYLLKLSVFIVHLFSINTLLSFNFSTWQKLAKIIFLFVVTSVHSLLFICVGSQKVRTFIELMKLVALWKYRQIYAEQMKSWKKRKAVDERHDTELQKSQSKVEKVMENAGWFLLLQFYRNTCIMLKH